MTKFTLTLLDTSGIQGYIFSSNRLQENIGASEIVYQATTLWAFKALEDAGIKRAEHNIERPDQLDWGFRPEAFIEKTAGLKAEVIQAAGGNTLILFREQEASREFVRQLTLRILKDAPGLSLLAQHDDEFEFDGKQAALPGAIASLHEKMQKHKRSRRTPTPFHGMGVTAMCDSTGLPAVSTLGGKIRVLGKSERIGLPGETSSDLVSAEAAAKRGWRGHANQRLKFMLKQAADDFIFPFDFEKLGRFKGEESYIAVIHADGNRMGDRVREIGEDAPDDRKFIENLREFSKKIETISRSSLETVVGLVVQAVKQEDIPVEEDTDEDGRVKKYLPFRPLVFGGDDVTFVCNGLIGVSLAATYIDAFEKEARNQGLTDFHASAGVSIVKLHYPFARAYELAEELTASAKSLNRKPAEDCSTLDWHFAQSGLSGSLKVIRDREYTVPSGALAMRPLKISGEPRSWDTVSQVMKTFDEKWADKHNKVVALREVLRNGEDAVRRYLEDFDLIKEKLPHISGMDDIRETGWKDGICYYFDAIELLDHYVSLETKEKEAMA